jgi:hypothetical protein
MTRDFIAWYLEKTYGLTLTKCGGPRAVGGHGSWKTGWMVSGSLPGCQHTWTRYRSLREVAFRFGISERVKA